MIVTGRVLATGDDSAVPSTIAGLERHDYTGTAHYFVLYTGNMAMNRTEVLAVGGFDEALRTAEDNDLCYRWLTSGRRLIYEPSMVVWHNDWRSPEELELVYASYCRGQGAVYAKHISAGDFRMRLFPVARGLLERSRLGAAAHRSPPTPMRTRGAAPCGPWRPGSPNTCAGGGQPGPRDGRSGGDGRHPHPRPVAAAGADPAWCPAPGGGIARGGSRRRRLRRRDARAVGGNEGPSTAGASPRLRVAVWRPLATPRWRPPAATGSPSSTTMTSGLPRSSASSSPPPRRPRPRGCTAPRSSSTSACRSSRCTSRRLPPNSPTCCSPTMPFPPEPRTWWHAPMRSAKWAATTRPSPNLPTGISGSGSRSPVPRRYARSR